jgi:ATP/ADP translocase
MFIALLAGFRGAGWQGTEVSIALYLSISSASFWWNSSESRRFRYRNRGGPQILWFIGSGGLLGGVIGGAAATAMLEFTPMKTLDLLLTCAVILIVTFLLNLAMGRMGLYREVPVKGRPVVTAGGWRALLSSRYLIPLPTLAVFQLAQPVIEYQRKRQRRATGTDARTQYISSFFSVLGVISIGINLLVTPFLHRYLGVMWGMVTQPLVLAMSSLAFLAQPTLMVASVMKIGDRGLSYSINRASKEQLYIPVDPVRTYHQRHGSTCSAIACSGDRIGVDPGARGMAAAGRECHAARLADAAHLHRLGHRAGAAGPGVPCLCESTPRTRLMANAKRTDAAALAFALFAATTMIAQQVAGKATRDALFLSNFDVTNLPKVMIASAIASMTGVLIMSRLLSRFSPFALVPAVFGASAILFIGEWLLLASHPGTASVVLYLHMAVFGAILISGFWSVINERFDPHSAKQRVARIAAAATFGGVIGGVLAERVTALLDVRTMLLFLSGLHIVCLLAVRGIGTPARAIQIDQGVKARSAFSVISRTPYLQWMAALMVLIAAMTALMDYAFKRGLRPLHDSESLVGFSRRFTPSSACSVSFCRRCSKTRAATL